MTNPPGASTSDPLRTSCAVVVVAAKLLRSSWDQLSDGDRASLLDRLVHHGAAIATALEGATEPDGGVRDRGRSQTRIDDLEAAAAVSRGRIDALEALALDAEAAALVSDARIVELAAEVERLLAAQEHAAAIEQAKGVLMNVMQVSPDTAFAVLVAAAQQDGVTLADVAHRLTGSRDESSDR